MSAMGTRPAAARVLLVRHGESTWNAEGRWQGRADPPLSPDGERQARDAADALPAVAVVWASDLARARQTAELVAPAGAAVRLDARLRERDVGAWAGLTRAEIDARDPGALEGGRRPPGWESDEALGARCWPALRAVTASLASGLAGLGLVVTHGGLIRVVAEGLDVAAWPVPNLGGVWLERRGDAFSLGPRVSLLDAGARLDAAPVTPAD
jgi:broad specificity phosphatase PhoE